MAAMAGTMMAMEAMAMTAAMTGTATTEAVMTATMAAMAGTMMAMEAMAMTAAMMAATVVMTVATGATAM